MKNRKKFHQLKVNTVRFETNEAVQIGFGIPKALQETFRFHPGQYLTIKVNVNGTLLRRAYSICSAVKEENISILIKRLAGGKVSNFLNDQIKYNDQFEVLPPSGHFKLTLDKAHKAHYLFIGAGSGITPLMSMIQSMLDEEPESSCSLLYGSRNEQNTIYKNKLDRLQLVYGERFSVRYVLSRPEKQKVSGFSSLFTQPKLSWTGEIGRVDKPRIQSFLDKHQAKEIKGYFICGPGQMIESAVSTLEEIGIDKSLIHREYFSAADTSTTVEVDTSNQVIRATPSKVLITLDGLKKEVSITNNTNIVQALLDNGVEPPYSCLEGTCSTCMAKIIKGEVRMDVSIGLEEDEKEKGYILTCQSHPITDEVELSYDID